MNRFELNNATLDSIRASVGMDVSGISDSDVLTVDRAIETRTKRPLIPAMTVGDISPRGSVYLMYNRTFSAKEIDNAIDRIK